ncbi:MAG: hypothetical protein Kow0031_33710 [Anaerolineae bacterium]
MEKTNFITQSLSQRSAQQIFDEAFAPNTYRTPRSEAYKAGVLAALQHHIDRAELVQPFEWGTPAADAWSAGVVEGNALFAREQMLNFGATDR